MSTEHLCHHKHTPEFLVLRQCYVFDDGDDRPMVHRRLCRIREKQRISFLRRGQLQMVLLDLFVKNIVVDTLTWGGFILHDQ